MGGTSIFRAGPNDPNLRVIVETLTDNGRCPVMAQRFIPESPKATSAFCSSMANRYLTHWHASRCRASRAAIWPLAAQGSANP